MTFMRSGIKTDEELRFGFNRSVCWVKLHNVFMDLLQTRIIICLLSDVFISHCNKYKIKITCIVNADITNISVVFKIKCM